MKEVNMFGQSFVSLFQIKPLGSAAIEMDSGGEGQNQYPASMCPVTSG